MLPLRRNVILPLWQHRQKLDSFPSLQKLERSQWWSLDQLTDYQWERLGSLLTYVYTSVPYYRMLMQERSVTPEYLVKTRQLHELPILTRAIINQHRKNLLAENLPNRRFLENATGGSTGEPLHFFDDWEGLGHETAAAWRADRWAGASVGDPQVYLWGANFDNVLFDGFKGRIRKWLWNRLTLPAWQLDEDSARLFLHKTIAFQPRLLIGYSGSLFQWARLLNFQRQYIPHLGGIIATAETLYDEWREAIEHTFGVSVYNRYGGRDFHFLAQECSSHEGLHIAVEKGYVEITQNNEPVANGEMGEIIITKFNNRAMPFIRYQTGDLGVLSTHQCGCGRGLPLFKRIEGRLQDAFLTPSGRIVSGPFFAHLIKDCPEVKEFQVHQLAIDRLRLLITTEPKSQFSSRARIEEIIHNYLGQNIVIEFELVDEIPRTPSGKHHITISHLSEEINRHWKI